MRLELVRFTGNKKNKAFHNVGTFFSRWIEVFLMVFSLLLLYGLWHCNLWYYDRIMSFFWMYSNLMFFFAF